MGRGGKNLKQKASSNDFNYISNNYDKHTEEGGGIKAESLTYLII